MRERASHSVLYRHFSNNKPTIHSVVLNACNLCKLGYCQLLAFILVVHVAAGVAELGVPISPAAVARLIVAVAVYTIKGILLTGSLTHIFKEILEVVPAITYGYTSATIILIPSTIRAVTPLVHFLPTDICQAFLSALAIVAMFYIVTEVL